MTLGATPSSFCGGLPRLPDLQNRQTSPAPKALSAACLNTALDGITPRRAVTHSPCLFCDPDPERVFYGGDNILALCDAFPVSGGHAVIITKRRHLYLGPPGSTPPASVTNADSSSIDRLLSAVELDAEELFF